MKLHDTNSGQVFRSEILDSVAGIVHGFGVRGIGVAKYLDALGIEDRYIFETDQVHGNTVHYIMYPKKGPKLGGDAFITDRPGIVCFVRSADCVPIIIADTNRPAVAAIHAGWRGTAEDVVGSTLCAMRQTFGTRSRDCVAAIGPRICGGCYEVGDEVVANLKNLKVDDGWSLDDNHIDLGRINKSLLIRNGIDESNIDISNECSKCNPVFASYRRDKDDEERQFSFIMLA